MAYTATGSVVSTASAVTAVATDPYLPEVVNLVLKLRSLEKKTTAQTGPAGAGTGAGVGLRNVVGPLRTFVKIQERPWILPVAVVGIFGTVFAAGYFVAKARK